MTTTNQNNNDDEFYKNMFTNNNNNRIMGRRKTITINEDTYRELVKVGVYGESMDYIIKRYYLEGLCPDCNIHFNSFHHFPCQGEICPRCGYQFISCGCGVV